MTADLNILCDDNADSDAIDAALGRVQAAVRAGVDVAALAERCKDSLIPASGRCLCLEAFAGARCSQHAADIYAIVLRFLDTGEPNLQFSAVAAACELPRARREGLVPVIAVFSRAETCLGRAARVYCQQFGSQS